MHLFRIKQVNNRGKRNEIGVSASSRQSVSAMAFAVVLISCSFAHAVDISCRNLATGSTKQLLETVDRHSVQYGGGVQIGEYDCGERIGRLDGGAPTPAPFLPQPNGCDWRTTLRDDRMLDPDHRLVYVFSSHLTGSGAWSDFLVFGCVSGQVKTVYLRQVCSCRLSASEFGSAPPALRSKLEDYMERPPIYDLPAPQ